MYQEMTFLSAILSFIQVPFSALIQLFQVHLVKMVQAHRATLRFLCKCTYVIAYIKFLSGSNGPVMVKVSLLQKQQYCVYEVQYVMWTAPIANVEALYLAERVRKYCFSKVRKALNSVKTF